MTASDAIQLTTEKETLFITLSAKAMDYRSGKSILRDRLANTLVEQAKIDESVRRRGRHHNRCSRQAA